MDTMTIDYDAGIGTILSNFDSEYINHVLDDSIGMRFRPFAIELPCLPDVLYTQFNSIKAHAPSYIETIDEVMSDTFGHIIYKICNYFNLEFLRDVNTFNNDELYHIAKVLYEIFVSKFTSNIIDFISSYIINNRNYIASYLKTLEKVNPARESDIIDQDMMLVNANVNIVVYNMASYDIPLDQILSYFLPKEVFDYISPMFADLGDVFKNFFACYIINPETSSNILTLTKLAIQNKLSMMNNIQN